VVKITDIGGRTVFLNIDIIERITSSPHTIISLLNGTTILAKETPEEIVARIAEFRRLCNEKSSLEIVSRREGDGASEI